MVAEGVNRFGTGVPPLHLRGAVRSGPAARAAMPGSVVALAPLELDDEGFAVHWGAARADAHATRVGSDRADADATDGRAPGAPGALAQLADPAERAYSYAGRSKSTATIRAFAAGWCDFLSFCEHHSVSALPASDETVAAYLADMADRQAKAATIARRLVVISEAHKAADLPSPTTSSLVSRTHAGIRRTLSTAQTGKAPAVVDDLKRMLEKVPNIRVGLRDRALLLLGFAGAFRRSELVSLDVADLEFTRAGLIVTQRRSKTDQEGKSRRLGIPYGSSEHAVADTVGCTRGVRARRRRGWVRFDYGAGGISVGRVHTGGVRRIWHWRWRSVNRRVRVWRAGRPCWARSRRFGRRPNCWRSWLACTSAVRRCARTRNGSAPIWKVSSVQRWRALELGVRGDAVRHRADRDCRLISREWARVDDGQSAARRGQAGGEAVGRDRPRSLVAAWTEAALSLVRRSLAQPVRRQR
jgi:integrase